MEMEAESLSEMLVQVCQATWRSKFTFLGGGGPILKMQEHISLCDERNRFTFVPYDLSNVHPEVLEGDHMLKFGGTTYIYVCDSNKSLLH
jgi:hypothetical protein